MSWLFHLYTSKRLLLYNAFFSILKQLLAFLLKQVCDQQQQGRVLLDSIAVSLFLNRETAMLSRRSPWQRWGRSSCCLGCHGAQLHRAIFVILSELLICFSLWHCHCLYMSACAVFVHLSVIVCRFVFWTVFFYDTLPVFEGVCCICASWYAVLCSFLAHCLSASAVFVILCVVVYRCMFRTVFFTNKLSVFERVRSICAFVCRCVPFYVLYFTDILACIWARPLYLCFCASCVVVFCGFLRAPPSPSSSSVFYHQAAQWVTLRRTNISSTAPHILLGALSPKRDQSSRYQSSDFKSERYCDVDAF